MAPSSGVPAFAVSLLTLGSQTPQTAQAIAASQMPLTTIPPPMSPSGMAVPILHSWPEPLGALDAQIGAESPTHARAANKLPTTTPASHVHFATYSTYGFEECMTALCSEAHGSGIFAGIHCFDKIPTEAMEGRWNRTRQKPGVGTEWLYQPALVQYLLRNIVPDGDVLVFAEAGVEISQNSTEWNHLLDFMGGPAGAHFLAFQRSNIPEYEVTKAIVFQKFGVWMDDLEVRSYQIANSYFIMRNARPVHLWVNKWANLVSEPNLLNDSPSNVPNHEQFVEHHHEASLWSMLVKANRKGSSCRPIHVVQDLKLRILPYSGCDDTRRVEAWPIQAHCERHRSGLRNRLRAQHASNEPEAEADALAEAGATAKDRAAR